MKVFLWCSDKSVLSFFSNFKLESVATVIPNHRVSSQIILIKRRKCLDEKISARRTG